MITRRALGGWCLGALTGLAGLPRCAFASSRERILRIALSTSPLPLDPALAGGGEQAVSAVGAYETLVLREAKEGFAPATFSPQIALAWSSEEDGRSWTFELAAGKRFDDGGRVDAGAVKFSFDRLMAIGREAASDALEYIQSVTALTPTAVRISCRKRAPDFLSIVADRSTYVVNPAVMRHERSGDWGSGWLATRTAGSGPYVLQPVYQEGIYELSRNRFYRGARTYFERLIYSVIADPTLRALSVRRGQTDIAFLMPFETVKDLRTAPGVRVVSVLTLAFQNLAFNLSGREFRDVRARRAVASAINVKDIVSYIRGGEASIFRGPLPAGMLGADPASYRISYDPEAALALARQAGIRPGTIVSMVYPGVSPETDTVAEYIQAVLHPLGFLVRLERLSVVAYLDRMQRGNYDLAFMGSVAHGDDPSQILDNWFNPVRAGVNNPARYANPRVSSLIERSNEEADPVKRAKLIREICQLVNADLPYVYLQQTKVSIALRDDILGFTPDPVDTLRLNFGQLRRETSAAR